METVLRQAKRMRKTFQLMENKMLDSPIYTLNDCAGYNGISPNELPKDKNGIYFISTKDNWTHLGGQLDEEDVLYVGKTKTTFNSRLSCTQHEVLKHCVRVKKNINIRYLDMTGKPDELILSCEDYFKAIFQPPMNTPYSQDYKAEIEFITPKEDKELSPWELKYIELIQTYMCFDSDDKQYKQFKNIKKGIFKMFKGNKKKYDLFMTKNILRLSGFSSAERIFQI